MIRAAVGLARFIFIDTPNLVRDSLRSRPNLDDYKEGQIVIPMQGGSYYRKPMVFHKNEQGDIVLQTPFLHKDTLQIFNKKGISPATSEEIEALNNIKATDIFQAYSHVVILEEEKNTPEGQVVPVYKVQSGNAITGKLKIQNIFTGEISDEEVTKASQLRAAKDADISLKKTVTVTDQKTNTASGSTSAEVPKPENALNAVFAAHSNLQADITGTASSLRFLKQTKSISELLNSTAQQPRLEPDKKRALSQLENLEQRIEETRTFLNQAIEASKNIKNKIITVTSDFNTLNDAHNGIFRGLKDIRAAVTALKQINTITQLIQRDNNPAPDQDTLNKSELSTLKHLENLENHIKAAHHHIAEARDASKVANTVPNLNRSL